MLWHIMQYYSQYGHRDFVLCLGYKANVDQGLLSQLEPSAYSDCVISEFGKKVEMLGEARRTGASRWSIPAFGAISASG